VEKTISVSRFFARVDSSDRPNEFLLFQAGKFFPLYRVNTADSEYTLLTSSTAKKEKTGQEDKSPNESAGHAQTARPGAPVFKPTRTSDRVAGVNCRVVLEMEDGKPVIEHCMANKAGLGLTERESRTLARLFVLFREQGYGWPGAATKDEDFVSVRSKPPGQAETLQLLSVSTSPLKRGHLKVPSEFSETGALSAPEPASSSQTTGTTNAATVPD
jgi:hypothetical protein